jgi:hypothetical protein
LFKDSFSFNAGANSSTGYFDVMMLYVLIMLAAFHVLTPGLVSFCKSNMAVKYASSLKG